MPIRPSLVIVYAETLLPATRQRLQVAFGAPVIDEYGLDGGRRDGGPGVRDAGRVPRPAGRLLRGSGRSPRFSRSDGTEGLVVVTNLYSRLVPILRYCTEDYAVLTHQPCRCG